MIAAKLCSRSRRSFPSLLSSYRVAALRASHSKIFHSAIRTIIRLIETPKPLNLNRCDGNELDKNWKISEVLPSEGHKDFLPGLSRIKFKIRSFWVLRTNCAGVKQGQTLDSHNQATPTKFEYSEVAPENVYKNS